MKKVRRDVSVERSKADGKNKSRRTITTNQNTIIINIIFLYFGRYGKSTMKFNLKTKFT